MDIINIVKSSQWIYDRLLSNTENIEGRILAEFNSSIILYFQNFSLIHLTNNSENLSPYSLYTDSTFFKNSSNAQIVLDHQYIYLNNFKVQLRTSTERYNQSSFYSININDLSKILENKPYFSDDIYQNKFLSVKKNIIDSIKARNIDRLTHDLTSIVGLGNGLTPFGDDYVVGVLYGLKTENIPFSIEEISLFYDNITGFTNKVSLEFIKHALFSRFSETITNQQWDTLLSYGSSSGYYTLLGIFDAVRSLRLVPSKG